MTENDNQADTEKNERLRQLALIRLQDPFYAGLTAAKFGTWQNYGEILEDIYTQTVSSGAPSPGAYDELFAKRLLNGEAITDKSLQNDASQLMAVSIADAKVEDLMKLLGSEKDVSSAYQDKYVKELSEEEAQAMQGTYLRGIVDSQAAQALMVRQAQARSGLEDIFCKPDAPEAPKAPSTPAPTTPKRATKKAGRTTKKKAK